MVRIVKRPPATSITRSTHSSSSGAGANKPLVASARASHTAGGCGRSGIADFPRLTFMLNYAKFCGWWCSARWSAAALFPARPPRVPPPAQG